MSIATLFDYDVLDVETRIVVQQRTLEIKERVKRSARDLVEIGERLLEVKQKLGHGQFGRWLEMEFEWSERTAQNLMNVADVFKSADFSDLSFAPSALCALASPSVPQTARNEALGLASSGHHVTHAEAKQIVEKHKPDRRVAAPQANLFAEQDEAAQRLVEAEPPDEEPEEEDEEERPASASVHHAHSQADEFELESPSGVDEVDELPTDDPEVWAERWNARIKKLKHDIFVLANSVERRGGIANLSKAWPRRSVRATIVHLTDLRDTANRCIAELRGTKK